MSALLPETGHYIHDEDPGLVLDEIRADRARRHTGMTRISGRAQRAGGTMPRVPGWRVTAVIAVCVCLVGCDPHLTDGIEARNETEVTVHFEIEANGERFSLPGSYAPGESGVVISGSALGPDSLVTEDGCTTGDLIALTQDGEEIARQAPPMCDGDVFVVGP